MQAYKPGTFSVPGFELQLSGMRHVSFLAQQEKMRATHHCFFHLMGKVGGSMGKNFSLITTHVCALAERTQHHFGPEFCH